MATSIEALKTSEMRAKVMLGLLTVSDSQHEDPDLHPPTPAEDREELASVRVFFFFFYFPFFPLKTVDSAGQGEPHHQFWPAHGGHRPAEVKGRRATSSQHAAAALGCQKPSAALQEVRVAHSSPKCGTGSFSWCSTSRLADSSLSIFITSLFHIKRLMALLTLTQSCLALKRN